MQASLFTTSRRSPLDDLFDELDHDDGARWYQREAIDSIKRELQTVRSTLLVMATGTGKCLGRGTQVMLFDGTTLPVELVMPGDMLMGPDSRPRRVLSTTQGVGPLFEIRPVKGDPWVCNWCHVLTLKHTETGRITDIPLDSYLEQNKNFKHLHKQFSVGVDFEECKIPEVNPYIFGLWLGDGTKSLNSFCISKPDPEVQAALEDFALTWDAHVTTTVSPGKCPNHYVSAGRVGRAGFPLLKVMRRLFADGGIPHDYLTGTRDDRLQLLAGLLDSDGHYNNGGFEIAQRSTKIADGICFLARSLGFKVTRCVKVVNGTDYQRMVISGDLSVVPNRIPRKKAAPRAINKDALRTGFSVHPLGDGDYYGFELDGDGRFLLGDFTVTHNTRCFSQLIREWDRGPVLVLAHREELIQQAKASLEAIVGDYVDVERAQEQSSFRSRFVVGSIDSVRQKKRLERLGHERFSLVVIDEAHHAASPSYRRVLDWFGPARIVGVTATPDRADEQALGQCFDSVSYVYDIESGIDDGFLVPLEGRHVDVSEVDLSAVKKSAGELQAGDLDEVMLKAVTGIVHETLRLYPDRQGLAFFPGVRSAELAAQTFNEKIPNGAAWVSGETPVEQRAEIVRDFKAGRYKYLCNCQVFLEGFDAPAASLLIDGAPTLSRSRFAQKVGRITRSVCDFAKLRGKSEAAQRRALIAASSKPIGTVLDFVSNSGKHDLVTPEDLLGGKYTDDEVKLAKKAREKGQGGNVQEELEKARSELRRLASASVKAKVSATVREFDPFRTLGIHIAESKRHASKFGQPIPTGLWDALVKKGIGEDELRKLSKGAAGKLYTELKRRHTEGLCTVKQSKILSKYGVDPQTLSFARASEAIDYISRSGWRPDAAALHAVVTRQRLPGED